MIWDISGCVIKKNATKFISFMIQNNIYKNINNKKEGKKL